MGGGRADGQAWPQIEHPSAQPASCARAPPLCRRDILQSRTRTRTAAWRASRARQCPMPWRRGRLASAPRFGAAGRSSARAKRRAARRRNYSHRGNTAGVVCCCPHRTAAAMTRTRQRLRPSTPRRAASGGGPTNWRDENVNVTRDGLMSHGTSRTQGNASHEAQARKPIFAQTAIAISTFFLQYSVARQLARQIDNRPPPPQASPRIQIIPCQTANGHR